MYVCSFRVLHTIIPWYARLPHFLTTYSFIMDRVYPCTLTPASSHFCRYVQMDNLGSASANVEAWTLVNYLEEGGFPALLWDTLKDFGYTAYPEYLTRVATGQLLRCEVKVKISMCPTNPSWEEWEFKAQGRNLADTMQKAALEALTTFCGKHCDMVVGSAAKVIPLPERHIVPCVKHEPFLLA
jgi:hypothetical protein